MMNTLYTEILSRPSTGSTDKGPRLKTTVKQQTARSQDDSTKGSSLGSISIFIFILNFAD